MTRSGTVDPPLAPSRKRSRRLRHQARILGLSLISTLSIAVAAEATDPPVTAAAVANHDQWLAVGSQRGVRLCDPVSLKVIREWKPDYAQVNDLLFLPPADDEAWRLIVVGGTPAEFGTLTVLRMPEMVPERRIEFDGDVLYAVSMSTNGQGERQLWVGGHDHRVHRMKLTDESTTVLAAEHSRAVTAAVSLGTDRGVLTGGLDQNLRLWNSSDRTAVRSWNNHTAGITDLARRPASEGPVMVASASEDRTVRLWQPTIGRMVRFVRLDSVPRCIAWTPDGSRLVAGCDDGAVRIIDPDTVEVQNEIRVFRRPIMTMAVLEESDLVIVGSFDGALKRLDPERVSEPAD